jgi:Anti-sigma-K factor rskA
MNQDLHPGMDELIQYCMGSPMAGQDAAADGDATRVREHLRGCADCRVQAALLCGDMALIAMAVPQTPPPAGAKERLFQAAGLDLAEAGTKSAARSGAKANVVPIQARRSSPVITWGGWIVAAACLCVAIMVHSVDERSIRQLLSENLAMTRMMHVSAGALLHAQRAEQVLYVLTSPDAQRATLVAAHAKPEPTGHAVYLPGRGALVFTASNLAPLPANKTYELWVIPANGTAPVPAGTFQPDARGTASVMLPKLPLGVRAKAFGVTMENAGGSAAPTMPILLAGG